MAKIGGALTDNIPMLIAYIVGGLFLVWILYRAFWNTNPSNAAACSKCPNKK